MYAIGRGVIETGMNLCLFYQLFVIESGMAIGLSVAMVGAPVCAVGAG